MTLVILRSRPSFHCAEAIFDVQVLVGEREGDRSEAAGAKHEGYIPQGGDRGVFLKPHSCVMPPHARLSSHMLSPHMLPSRTTQDPVPRLLLTIAPIAFQTIHFGRQGSERLERTRSLSSRSFSAVPTSPEPHLQSAHLRSNSGQPYGHEKTARGGPHPGVLQVDINLDLRLRSLVTTADCVLPGSAEILPLPVPIRPHTHSTWNHVNPRWCVIRVSLRRVMCVSRLACGAHSEFWISRIP
jgi:hypothetical protein